MEPQRTYWITVQNIVTEATAVKEVRERSEIDARVAAMIRSFQEEGWSAVRTLGPFKVQPDA